LVRFHQNKSSMVFIKILYVYPVFSGVRVTRSLRLMCMFCRSFFVLLCFFFWPLCCLFFFDIRILITPLVSSNSSCTSRKSVKHCVHWDVLSDPKVVPQQNQLNMFVVFIGIR
jgi:hypothetical protein